MQNKLGNCKSTGNFQVFAVVQLRFSVRLEYAVMSLGKAPREHLDILKTRPLYRLETSGTNYQIARDVTRHTNGYTASRTLEKLC